MKRAHLEGMDLPLRVSVIAFLMTILPSALKVGILKLGGANIGHKVRIGFGSVVIADKFSKITIGDYTKIRNFTYIICKEIDIGNYVFIGMHVWIWGSGKLYIKKKANIGSRVIIDIRCNNFHLGEYSGLGPGSIVYTHSHGQPYTQGYFHMLKDVVLEDFVYGALKIIILPGVTIGRDSVIGAGAVVTKSIPPNSFAVGMPAKVVKKADQFRDKIDAKELHKRTLRIAMDLIDYYGYKVVSEKKSEKMDIITFERPKFFSKETWQILITDPSKIDQKSIEKIPTGRNLILFSTGNVPPIVSQRIPFWFDLKNLKCTELSKEFIEDIWYFLWHTWSVVCDIEPNDRSSQ